MAQGQRARVLGSILIALQPDYSIALRRAPDWKVACTEAWGAPTADATVQVLTLRELLGVVGAHEWRKKGVAMPVLGKEARIYPHYGVFSPVRGEYVDLVAQAALPATATQKAAVAWDIGTGTGVLAAVLLRVAKGQQFAFGPSLAVAGWLVFIANEKVLAALGWWLRASGFSA